MYTELTAREKSPCPVAEPTGRLNRENGGPRDGDRAPDAPPPTGLPALAPGPLSPCLGLLSRPARLQLWLSGLTSPETRCQSRGRSRAKAPPGTARHLRSQGGSSPRGTENNGRERPALRRAHWPPRTAPGNSVFLLADTDPAGRREGAWAKGIVGGVVHRADSDRGARSRVWD